MTDDIELEGKLFTAIASISSNQYSGIFNGNGKKILNLNIEATTLYAGALFGFNGGTIQNLTIESGSIKSAGRYSAGFTAVNNGTLLNCLNKASISGDNTYNGGLAGQNNGNIINSQFGVCQQ